MKNDAFKELAPNIIANENLRVPQREAYEKIISHYSSETPEREVGIILPVGCGKSGLMTIAPFATTSTRTLVIAPSVRIAKQLLEKDFNSTSEELFYKKCAILAPTDIYPEVAEIRGTTSNVTDLEEADVIITNIQQLQGERNKWITALPPTFFDLILVDEGHHNVAASWDLLRKSFPDAKIVNVSATPIRADGQIMAGEIIYSFPIIRAIQEGYIKRLKAVVLNPASLCFVRNIDGEEIEVNRDEVVKLGENDADFRRSILTSKETLDTIVDCSIQQLQELRRNTGEPRHKIIVSALNYRHCIQIKEVYQARGLRADYIHSKEEENSDAVLKKLDNNELDVIIQVRKLGEGFDHKFLSVAVVCNIFSNLSPFVQFIGRVMRTIDQKNISSPNNQGIVIYHAGANVAQRWEDFKEFSEADQAYFDDLFPTEEIFNFSPTTPIEEIEPSIPQPISPMKIITQTDVTLQEDELVSISPEQEVVFNRLVDEIGREQLMKRLELTRLQPRKQDSRRAARAALDEEVKNSIGQLMHSKKINPKGRQLDKKHTGRENFVIIKSEIDKKLAEVAGKPIGTREGWGADVIAEIRKELPNIINAIAKEL